MTSMHQFEYLAKSSASIVHLEFPGFANVVVGFLRYEPESGISIELSGDDLELKKIMGSGNAPIMFEAVPGELSDGTKVTALDVFATSSQFGSQQAAGYRFVVNALIVGFHLKSKDSRELYGFSFKLDGVGDWYGPQEMLGSTRLNDHVAHGRAIAHVKLAPTVGVSSPNSKVSLFLTHTADIDQQLNGSAKISSNFYSSVFRETGFSFEDLEFATYCGLEFLSSLVCAKIPILKIGVHRLGQLQTSLGDCDGYIVYHSQPREISRSYSWYELVLPYSALKNKNGRPDRNCLETMWLEWARNHDVIALPYSLCSSAEAIKKHLIEPSFLLTTQAVESLHRLFPVRGKYLSDSEYEKVRDDIASSIPNHVPSSLRQAVKVKIHYGNEYSLRKRISTLCDFIGPKTVDKSFGIDFKDFIAVAVNTRNQIVHNDPSSSLPILPAEYTYRAEIVLRYFCMLCIYKLIGVDGDTCSDGLRRIGELQFACRSLGQRLSTSTKKP